MHQNWPPFTAGCAGCGAQDGVPQWVGVRQGHGSRPRGKAQQQQQQKAEGTWVCWQAANSSNSSSSQEGQESKAELTADGAHGTQHAVICGTSLGSLVMEQQHRGFALLFLCWCFQTVPCSAQHQAKVLSERHCAHVTAVRGGLTAAQCLTSILAILLEAHPQEPDYTAARPANAVEHLGVPTVLDYLQTTSESVVSATSCAGN